MATHDYSIANQSFPATRSDINNALSAIQSSNSAAAAPSGTGSTVAGELFYDTTNNKLRVATDANGTFVDVALNSSGDLTVATDLTVSNDASVIGTLGVSSTSTFTGEATFNGGAAFNDNDKATFGASDDLQIYHDSSNSYIKDAGTGSLYIKADNDIFLSRSANSEVYLKCRVDGAVTLYHNDNEKLATSSTGIDVTGNINVSSSAHIGDTNDYITWGDDSHMACVVNGGERVRIEADGDLHADGNVIAYSTTISDKNLKTGITPISDALDKVSQLNGVEFTYKTDGKRSAGLIAQEVEKVLPSAVEEKELPLKIGDGEKYKVLQYDQTIGLLVESIKELKDIVEEQAKEIKELKNT